MIPSSVPPHLGPGLRRTLRLTDHALALTPGSAVVGSPGRVPAPLPPARHPYGALVGFRCAPTAESVATCLELTAGPRRGDRVVVAVGAHRSGFAMTRIRHPAGHSAVLSDVEGPLIDVARRALGLATPPPTRYPVELSDAVFAHRLLAQILDAAPGTPFGWRDICGLHPLSRSSLTTPRQLWGDRRRFAGMHGWPDMRQRITESLHPCGLGVTPSIAAWLDDGSFSRWLLATVPEPEPVLDDVCELLDSTTVAAIREALAPVARS